MFPGDVAAVACEVPTVIVSVSSFVQRNVTADACRN